MSIPKTKGQWILTIVVLLITVVGIFFLLNSINNVAVSSVIIEDYIEVKSGLFDSKINFADIQSVESKEGFSFGRRTNGIGTNKINAGKFNNTELGDYICSVNLNVQTVVIIKTKDNLAYVVNQNTLSATMQFLEDIRAKM